MRESDLDREYRLYVEDPYVWISPFAAFAQANYELQKLEASRIQLEADLMQVPNFAPAKRGLIEEKLIDLRIVTGAVKSIQNKF